VLHTRLFNTREHSKLHTAQTHTCHPSPGLGRRGGRYVPCCQLAGGGCLGRRLPALPSQYKNVPTQGTATCTHRALQPFCCTCRCTRKAGGHDCAPRATCMRWCHRSGESGRLRSHAAGHALTLILATHACPASAACTACASFWFAVCTLGTPAAVRRRASACGPHMLCALLRTGARQGALGHPPCFMCIVSHTITANGHA
jgi:hypothetical protein